MDNRNGPNPLWEAVMAFIIRYKMQHDGIAPSMQEICDACGLMSKSHADYILERLEDAGRIRRGERASRMIMIPGGQWSLIQGA